MKFSSIEIIKKLQSKGFESYWAGGCVRDILLGKEPKDFDIVTSATPDQIEELINKTIPIGKKYGVILGEANGHHFEIATFRSDSGYSDGRRPDFIEFKTAKEDAMRRDFTINGIFYNPITDQIFDYVKGQADLDAKLIRFIKNPTKRIQEDHLRILRAVRFKTTLNFQYEPQTYQAIKNNAHLIKKVSKERVRDELNKMLQETSRVNSINDLEDLGLLNLILPEIQNLKGVGQPAEFHHGLDVYEHTMKALKLLDNKAPLSLIMATLFHDSGKYETFELKEGRIKFEGHAQASSRIVMQVLSRLNYPTNFIKKVAWLCEYHMSIKQIFEMPKVSKIKWFLKPYFLELLELHKADSQSINPDDTGYYKHILEEYRYEMSLRPDELPKLISGTEIMTLLNLKPGPLIKKIINEITDLQLEHKIKTKQQAIQWLKKKYCI